MNCMFISIDTYLLTGRKTCVEEAFRVTEAKYSLYINIWQLQWSLCDPQEKEAYGRTFDRRASCGIIELV